MSDSGLQDYNEDRSQRGSSHENPSSDFEQSKEDRDLLKWINSTFSKAKKYREAYDRRWKDYYQYFRGKQWKQKRPAYRHSDVINLIFPSIQNQVPIMTDARPTIDFVAEIPADIQFAKIMSDLINSDWDRLNWSYPLLEILYDSHIYGTGLGSLDFNEQADHGLGSARWISLEPMYCFPTPGATDINTGRTCSEFQYAEPMKVDQLKRMYPDLARYIKPDVRNIWEADKTDIQNILYQSQLDSKTLFEGNETLEQANGDSCMVITTYCRPVDTEEKQIVSKDPNSGEEITSYQVSLKWPRGRKIVSTRYLILETSDLDSSNRQFPIQKLVNYVDPRSFWGISDIEQAEGPQMLFNKMVCFAMDVLTLTGNPIWIIANDSGVDVDNVFNIPGGIIEKEPGSEVRREPGVDLQPYVIQLIDRMKNWFDEVVGTTDVTRGVNPPGVVAARAIEALVQTGRTRIRQKTRNMDTMLLRELGQQYVELVLRNYTVPRVRMLTDTNGVDRYFKMHIEHLNIEGKDRVLVNYKEYKQNDRGELIEHDNTTRELIGTFGVRANTISSLPFEKADDRQVAIELYKLHAIDLEELLTRLDYPNRDAIIQRMKEAQMAHQSAGNSQQMAPGAA